MKAAVAVAVGVVVVAGLAAVTGASASGPAAPLPSCSYPSTGSISNRQVITYTACRFDRIEELLAPAPSPSPSPTATASPSPSPTPTVTPTVSPSPTPTSSPPPTGFPNAANTGVPAGVTLAPYTGPCTFRASDPAVVVIDGKNVAAACGEVISYTPLDLTIRNSIVPRVEVTYANQSLTITDSEVRAGDWYDGALWGHDINATRVEVTGGQHSVHCMDRCTITDSWLHGQSNPDGGSSHNNAFLSNGGTGMVLRGNTLHCDAILNNTDGGCTADVALFGDFDYITDVLVEGNLLKANNSSISYCAYGGWSPSKPYTEATYVRFIDNVFERGANGKCGVYGPATGFEPSGTGNVWSGNVWDDGGTVNY